MKGDSIALASNEVTKIRSIKAVRATYRFPEKTIVNLTNGHVLIAERFTLFQKVLEL